MKDRDFIDTNILVYAYDTGHPRKQTIATGLLTQAVMDESAILSTQVLSEFYTVVTGKIKKPLAPLKALSLIDTLAILPVQEIDLAMIRRAIETGVEYHISYWDSLIIAAAERGGCNRILSEDLNSGQSYHGLVVHNPFI